MKTKSSFKQAVEKEGWKFPITSQKKPHGRIAYIVSISFGECYLDISFFPS